MATTINDYLVDVVYRSVYNTKKFSKSLQTGASGLEDVENLLKVITMYQGFLEFVVDNDREFTSEEILSVVSHVDDILWSKGSGTVAHTGGGGDCFLQVLRDLKLVNSNHR